MRRWLAAGVVVLGAMALLAAAALGAFSRGGSSAAGPIGVAVKGDWKIAVKNPDGRVARVYRFHNVFNGATTIVPILAHRSTTGRYWLTLSDQSGGGANPCGDVSPASCFVFEPDDPNGSIAGWFGNLDVQPVSGQLVIRGEIEATRNGSFNHVRMLLSSCGAGTVAPNDCHPGSYGQFSAHTLASPVSLVTGQQAIVTVTYTFSAA